MKKQLSLAIVGILVLSSMSYHSVYGLWHKITSTAEKVGGAVESAAQKVGGTVEKGAQEVASTAQAAAGQVKSAAAQALGSIAGLPECADVVRLGTEWAGKKAAYMVAKTALDAAQKLRDADPQLIKLQTEKAGLIATRNSGLAGLKAVEELATLTGALGEVVGKAIGGAFDIQRMEFDMSLAELKQGKLPNVGATAMIGGKKVDFNVELDFKDVKSGATSIIKAATEALKSIHR